MAPMVGSMLPSFLYKSSAAEKAMSSASASVAAPAAAAPVVTTAFRPNEKMLGAKFMGGNAPTMKPFMAPAAIEMYSNEFYAACTVGGILSCGLTHMLVTPIDVVKCNMQTNPAKYSSIFGGFGTVIKEEGMAGLVRGWAPTLIGYSFQGACKFGLYEYFKKYYADMIGPENAVAYKDLVYAGGSASAEFFADIALCPWEAVKVRVQTTPGFAKGLTDGMPKFIEAEGFGGLYKGLTPLWARQIPYTVMKFCCFERTVELLYAYVVPKPKSECNKTEQLGVSFGAGYIAGVFCAVVSQPADNLVSKLNAKPGVTAGQVLEEMGMVGLATRGLPLRIIMVGTLTGLQWGIYDAFKVYVGLPTTGSAPPQK